MKGYKVYLDTSVISCLQAKDTPERMKYTWEFWEILKNNDFMVVISDVTIEELSQCPEPKQTELFEYLSQLEYHRADETDETLSLAKKYIEFKVLASSSFDDCRHIAIATIYGCEIIASWNFKHFVNLKTINKVQAVNKLLGYNEVSIFPPSMLLEKEE